MATNCKCVLCDMTVFDSDSFNTRINKGLMNKPVKGGCDIHYSCAMPNYQNDPYVLGLYSSDLFEYFKCVFPRAECSVKKDLLKNWNSMGIQLHYTLILPCFNMSQDYLDDIFKILWYDENAPISELLPNGAISALIQSIKRDTARSEFLLLKSVQIPKKYYTPENIILVAQTYSHDGERFKIVRNHLEDFMKQNTHKLHELFATFKTDAFIIKMLMIICEIIRKWTNSTQSNCEILKEVLNNEEQIKINQLMMTGVSFWSYMQLPQITNEMLIGLLCLQFQCYEIKYFSYDLKYFLPNDVVFSKDVERLTVLYQKQLPEFVLNKQFYEDELKKIKDVPQKKLISQNSKQRMDIYVEVMWMKKNVEHINKFLGLMVYIDSMSQAGCTSPVGNTYAINIYTKCLDYFMLVNKFMQNTVCSEDIVNCFEYIIRRKQYVKHEVVVMLGELALYANKIEQYDLAQQCLGRINTFMENSTALV